MTSRRHRKPRERRPGERAQELKRLSEERGREVSQADAARMTGMTPTYVSRIAKQYGLKFKHHYDEHGWSTTRRDLSGADWTRPTREIAKKFDVSEATVSTRRRDLGLPTYRELKRRAMAERRAKARDARDDQEEIADWTTTVDWTESDAEIASRVGLTRQAVYARRKTLGIPKRKDMA